MPSIFTGRVLSRRLKRQNPEARNGLQFGVLGLWLRDYLSLCSWHVDASFRRCCVLNLNKPLNPINPKPPNPKPTMTSREPRSASWLLDSMNKQVNPKTELYNGDGRLPICFCEHLDQSPILRLRTSPGTVLIQVAEPMLSVGPSPTLFKWSHISYIIYMLMHYTYTLYLGWCIFGKAGSPSNRQPQALAP